MISLLDLEGPVALHAAPDSLPERKGKSAQIMQLDMSKSVVDELLDCIRSGKAPQVLFGRTPTLKLDGKKYTLDATKERFRHEVYETTEEHAGKWEYRGVLSHGLAVHESDDSHSGVDTALEALKQNMADYERDRAAKATTLAELPLKSKAYSRSRNGLLKAPSNRSIPPSPSLLGQSPSHLTAPTSAPKQDTKQQAIMNSYREPMMHCLAIKALTLKDLMRKLAINTEPGQQKLVQKVLEPLAQYNEQNKTYRLKDKYHKELKPWSFGYDDVDRQTVINNAVNAFDRMRITKTDALWQKLLPKEERGKGKTLSKLDFSGAPVLKQPPAAKGTVALDKKTGLPKKAAPKKAEKDEKSRTPREKGDDSSTDVPKKKKEPKAVTGSSTPSVKASKNAAKASTSSNSHRAVLGTVSKPKTSSPLSSPPMNNSDIEAGSNSAKSSTKRKAESTSERLQPSTKKSKLDVASTTSPTKKIPASSSTTPVSLKRKADPTPDAPFLKSRKLNGVHAPSRPHSSSTSSSDAPLRQIRPAATATSLKSTPGVSSNSSSSGEDAVPLSSRQTLELAQKFKAYHAKYAKLYHELAGRATAPKAEERQQLEKMHKHLEAMKTEIWAGKLRG
ncbi:hypothetical protein P152DRAFT_90793 [Eremomyces bilateralis CBS 781.70]|uniref:RNA polymerase II elongation factor ELL N-terminal domain-containing protein n=1 Tax=Eremomyces bilateralis CBS 781.70 TaxID=1392243 RepID=A0A6G1FY46_9PEZI|nr:uncharacterized protein P152DRAFT_90793 [Eremomyces bilateralis CBS 781.70]KAF1810611.1 hypothetical protein P152DRAFT_90793 [Eremomyces bilateralis CBS 781.70]